jgi:plastocyanin
MLGAGGALLAGAVLPAARRAGAVVEIHMRSDPEGAEVSFDPIGILIEPGQTVRWVCDANVHTTTAYHPKNRNHSLRIPEGAVPWASDYLRSGRHFEVRLVVEGVYDYFCMPHEMAGMVGRIIVGKAVGPGTLPFDYFEAEGRPWRPLPPEAQRTFPDTATILRQKIVPAHMGFS